MKFSPIFFISFLNILLALIMVFSNWKKNHGIIYLSAFISLLSVYAITVSLMTEGGSVWLFAILMNHASPFFYLIPVLLFFYVRTTITDSIRFKKYDFLHFVPFFINLIGITPYLFTSFEYKYSIAKKIIGNLDAFTNYDFDMLYPYELNHVARPLQFLIYIIASVYIIVKFLPKLKESSGLAKKQFNYMFYSFVFIMLIILLANLNYLRISITFILNHDVANIAQMIKQNIAYISAVYFLIPLYFLFNPRLIYGMPQYIVNLDVINHESVTKQTDIKGIVEKNDLRSDDENEYFIVLSEKIMKYVEIEKPFLNPDFSVHDLCISLNAPRHHVQYCLNFILNTKFTDLKNEMRINYTIELLHKGATDNLSLEGIGKLSGFASPSNFFSAFKKYTGLTPNQWLENNRDVLVR